MTIVVKERIPAGLQRQRKKPLTTKRGKPVRKLIPVNDRRPSFIGSMKGTMRITGDIVSPVGVQWEAGE